MSTLGELRRLVNEEHADMPDDIIVVMSSDSEGNSFSPWSDHSCTDLYTPDSTWSGELCNPNDPDRDVPDDAVPCLVLWPTN